MSYIKIISPGFIHRGREVEVGEVIEYPYFAALALVSSHTAMFVQTSGKATGPTAAPKKTRGGNAAPKPSADMPSDGAEATESDSSDAPPASTLTTPTDAPDEPTGDIGTPAHEGPADEPADEPDDEPADDGPLTVDDLTPELWPAGAAKRLVQQVVARQDHNEMGQTIANLWPGDTPASKAGRMAYLQARLEE